MLLQKEELGNVEIRLESVDDLFTREIYGTYYIIVYDKKKNQMVAQQVFQERPMAMKYWQKFVDYWSNVKSYYGKRLTDSQKLTKNIATEKIINKAPWYYNQGHKPIGAKILDPEKVK